MSPACRRPRSRPTTCRSTSYAGSATKSRRTGWAAGTVSRSSPGLGWRTFGPVSTTSRGFPDPEARAIAAVCGGIRVHSVYVPNGRTPSDPHYTYKLARLDALRSTSRPNSPSLNPCDAGRAGATRQAARSRPDRCHPAARQGAEPRSPTGITAPACSTRTWGCGSTLCTRAARSRTGSPTPGSTARPARAPGRPITHP
jgi:hypothetical protein